MENENKSNCIVCEFRIKDGRKWGEWMMEREFQSLEVSEIIVNGDKRKPSYGCEDFDLGYLKAVNWLYHSRRNFSPKRAEFRITPQYRCWCSKRTEYIYKMVSQEVEPVSA